MIAQSDNELLIIYFEEVKFNDGIDICADILCGECVLNSNICPSGWQLWRRSLYGTNISDKLKIYETER